MSEETARQRLERRLSAMGVPVMSAPIREALNEVYAEHTSEVERRSNAAVAPMCHAALAVMDYCAGTPAVDWSVTKIADLIADGVPDLRRELEKTVADLCKWRAAIQRLTPGGSEFMSIEAVEAYAADKNRRLHEATVRAVHAEKELASEVERRREAEDIARDLVAAWDGGHPHTLHWLERLEHVVERARGMPLPEAPADAS